jgi:glycosyltransferase involved in cell wall biosynthesis/peptidoglycan/xylan/chitin deacetylase (PgdA/CDA1 family)
MDKRASIIVPYSGTSPLQFLLESLVLQEADFHDLEVIVTTTAEDLARRQAGPFADALPIKILTHTVNGHGHSAASLRNSGAKAAQSQRFVFVDSDCILHPGAIERHVCGPELRFGQIRELPFAAQGALRAQGERVFQRLWQASIGDYRHPSGGEAPRPAAWSDCYSGNLSISHEVFHALGGFDEEGHRCHDMDFGYRAAKIGAQMDFDPLCRAIHIEHPRTLAYRLEQLAGWERLVSKAPEARMELEDRSTWARERFIQIFRECERSFAELVAEIEGLRCGPVFCAKPGTDPQRLWRRLEGTHGVIIRHPTAEELRLRLHRDCWDFSILVPICDPARRPRWTVAIAAHDCEATIGRAIESVLRQTWQDFEIVIVDDASSDATAAHAAGYISDGRVRLLRHASNQGLAAALNSALAAARGTWLVQLDGDDWLERDCLAVLNTASLGEATVGLYGSPRIHSDRGVEQEQGWQVAAAEEHFSYAAVQAPRAYKVPVLKAAGGWPVDDGFRGRYYEDRRTLARMHEKGPVRYAGAVGYNVVERRQSLARSNPLEAAGAKLMILAHEAAVRAKRLSYRFEGAFLRAELLPLPDEPPESWSIIIPHRDQWPYLRLALHSWAQSDLPLDGEIVVVDDGSTDFAPFDPEAIDPRIRFVRLPTSLGAGAARNLGVTLTKGAQILFSDADQLVDPHVCRRHQHELRASPIERRITCGSPFARRAFTFLDGALPPHRKAQLVRNCRFDPALSDIAAILLQRHDHALVDVGPDLWKRAQRFAFNDEWARGWGSLLLEMGRELADYPHRWLRVGSSNVAMDRSTFDELGGFDDLMRSKEDWDFGLRAQKAGIAVRMVPDLEPLHQMHPVREARVGEDEAGAARLRAKHPHAIEALERSSPRYRPPGAVSILPGYAPGPQYPAESAKAGTDTSSFSLTFDDGPHPTGTWAVLEALGQHDALATFFMLGSQMHPNRSVVTAVRQAGHEIGVHGWSHSHPTTLSSQEARRQVRLAFDTIADCTGEAPHFFRPAYGILTPAIAEAALEMGLRIAGWDVTVRDWAGQSREEMIETLVQQPVAGRVYLFHDGAGDPVRTAEVVDWLLGAAPAQAKPVTLSRLAREAEVPGLETHHARPLSDWRDHSFIDLIVTGKI